MMLTKHEKQICDNVRYFFKHDFERYSQLAELADLKSVRYDATNSSTNINRQEDKVINASYYQEITDTVIKGLKALLNTATLNTYLFSRFLNGCNTVNQQSSN